MRVHVADHPLITHKLTVLRDKTTPSSIFRALAEELVTLLAYEATRNVRTTPVTVETPVAKAKGLALAEPRPLVVPILRAGLGMLEGMVKLLPTAEVGFLGMMRRPSRDEDAPPLVTWWEAPVNAVRRFSAMPLGRLVQPEWFVRVEFTDGSAFDFRDSQAEQSVRTAYANLAPR